jgi:hypothetical protein
VHGGVIDYFHWTIEPLGIIKSYPTLIHIVWFVNRSSVHHGPGYPIAATSYCQSLAAFFTQSHSRRADIFGPQAIFRGLRWLAAGQNLQMSFPTSTTGILCAIHPSIFSDCSSIDRVTIGGGWPRQLST